MEMREGQIAVRLDALTQPSDRFLVGPELKLGKTDECHPPEGKGVAGRQAERLKDVSFGFLAAAEKKLGPTDYRMGVGQISIQRYRPFAFSNAPSRAVCEHVDSAYKHVGQRMLRSLRQNLNQGCFRRREARGSVVGRKISPYIKIDQRRTNQSLNVIGIKRQGTFKKAARLRKVL